MSHRIQLPFLFLLEVALASLSLLRFHTDFSMILQTRTSGILIELACFREAAGRGNNVGLALNCSAE